MSEVLSIRTVREPGGDGWDAGIRTPIRSSRGCSLTVRRRPNKSETPFYQTRRRESTTWVRDMEVEALHRRRPIERARKGGYANPSPERQRAGCDTGVCCRATATPR